MTRRMERCGLDSSGSESGEVVGCCVSGDELSGYTGSLTGRGIVGLRRTLRGVTSLSFCSVFVYKRNFHSTKKEYIKMMNENT